MLIGIVTGIVAAQAVVLVLLWRRVAACVAARARVDRMGEAIAMLSETAEAGFAAVAQELDKQRRAPVVRPTATRASIARRVVKAAGAGESVEAIARRESMSEGEVRLHLALAESTRLHVVPRPAAAPLPVAEPATVAVAPTPTRAKSSRTNKATSLPTPAALPVARVATARKGARRAALRA
jgi:hypothetical protein